LARTLQRGMPQLRLAIEVLHPANEPPIQPFVPGFASTPLTGLALVCTRAQSRSRMFWSADERAANVSTFFSSLTMVALAGIASIPKPERRTFR
jgi:hypothetical protein